MAIDVCHLFGEGIPGEFPLHPFAATNTHLAQRHRMNTLNRRSETFWVVVHPEPTADFFQTTPRCTSAGNDRDTVSQRFSD